MTSFKRNIFHLLTFFICHWNIIDIFIQLLWNFTEILKKKKLRLQYFSSNISTKCNWNMDSSSISGQIERERERRGNQFSNDKRWKKNFEGFSRKKEERRTYRHDGRRWYELTRTRFASIPGAMIGVNSMVHHRHLYSFIRNVELLHASSSTRLNWGSPNCAQLHCHSFGSHVVSTICSSIEGSTSSWPTSRPMK